MPASPEPVRVAAPAPADDLGAWFGRMAAGPLAPALDLDVSDIDALAQVDAVRPTGLRIDGPTVAIDYVVEASAFHACRDLHHAGRAARTLRGRVEGDAWIFPPRVAPEPPHPGDEL